MPKSRDRGKRRRAQVRATQGAQHRAEERRKISYQRYRLRRIIGWSLVVLGVTIVASHWLTHLQVWDFASQGIEDLVAGYPMGVALGVGGAIVLSKA
ncbi:MAG: hypothetical protein ACR2L4_06830 [Actinomycetota bacterium]|nr:hypothetical protein [Actinomycetota bacterium]